MKFDEFYRRYGMKTPARLKDPAYLKTNGLVLPYQSVLYFLSLDDIELGPTPSWSLISNTDRDIVVKHYLDQPFKDESRHVIFEAPKEIKAYTAKYRRFTKLRNLTTALRNKNTILVGNTGMLRRGLVYQTSRYKTWRENTNFLRNAFHNFAKDIADIPSHYHFLPIPAPSRTFTRTDYNYITYEKNDMYISTFPTIEDMIHAHLWSFISFAKEWVEGTEIEDNNYHQSVFSLLPKEAAERLVLLFQVEDKVVIVTLAKFMELLAKENEQTRFMFFNSIIEQKTEINLNVDTDAEVSVDTDGKLIVVSQEAPAVTPKDTPAPKATKPKLPKEVKEIPLTTKTIDDELPVDIKVVSSDQRLLVKRIAEEGKRGNLSQREQSYVLKKVEQGNTVKMPGTNLTLQEFATITPKDLELKLPPKEKKHKAAVDGDYSVNPNQLLNEQYVTELMEKDMVRCLLSFQRAGLIVADVQKELKVDALGAKNSYNIQIVPVKGQPTPLKYDFPVVKPNGRFKMNGTEVFYVPQRSDMPIRKIKPHVVKLTSYGNQTMIERGRLRANNYNHWLMSQVEELVREKHLVVKHRDVADREGGFPYGYTLLGGKYQRIQKGTMILNLDPKQRETLYDKKLLEQYEVGGNVILGADKDQIIVLDQENNVTVYKAGKQTSTLSLETLLGIDLSKRKLDSVEVKVYSKYVPIGMVLGQRIGLTGLINILGVKPRAFVTGERGQSIGDDEFALVFSDKTLVFPTQPRKAALVLNSFNLVHKSLKSFNVADMDNPDAYFSLLEEMGLGLRYYTEIDILFDFFVDPMTEDLLKEMGEPTNVTELLIRSAELLVTNDSPKEINARYMRERNYERFNGFLYKAVVDAERVRRSRPAGNKAGLSVDPKRVMMDIQADASKNLVETSNPARNMREKALITFSGEGGRTSQTMTPELRAFDPSELGHTSVDNTADSGKVAINATRSHNTLVKNLRGVSYEYNKDVHGPESLFTTTALMMPGADRDELKRLNFLSTQYDSVYPTESYRPMPLHTSMEYDVPYMVDEEFANMAKEDGKVLEISPHAIRVLYKSGTETSVLLGRVYGKVAGITIPHELITSLKVGQRFKAGDALSWNSYYFRESYINPRRLDMCQAMIIPTLFTELPITFEDSSSMWSGLKEKQKVNITYERYCLLDFTDEVKDVVKLGTEVERDTPLLLKVPQHLQNESILKEEVTEALKELGVGAPKADSEGVIEKIEVFYYGIKEDLSPSLKTLANASDRHFKQMREKYGRTLEGEDGMITSPVVFAGSKLMPGNVMIKFYITKLGLPTVSGNKTVNACNLKNTVTQYFQNEIDIINSDEKGHQYFSYNGQNARIVFSPIIQGLGNRGLILGTQSVVKAYRGTK